MIDNETMEYRGYKALVQFSNDDECLIGRVLGIEDIIGFHGDSVAEVRAAFAEAVDSYIANNKSVGRQPNQPAEFVPVAVDPALYEAAKGRVQGTTQTVNEFVNTAVKQALYPQHV